MRQIWFIVFVLPLLSLSYGSESPAALQQYFINPIAQQHIVHLNYQENTLARSSQAHSMSWLPALYDASGLSGCMSKGCFMVNALAKMKEAITSEENRLACLKVGADLAGVSLIVDEQPNTRSYALCLANYVISGVLFFGTLWYKNSYDDSVISVTYPRHADITPVQTSCSRIKWYFNQTWGMDWAQECIMKSKQYDFPCNVTAAKIEFEKNGHYFYDASACCFDKIDPLCNQVIVNYMNNTYPVLYAQAENLYAHLTYLKDQIIKARAIPITVVVPSMVTLNLLFQLAGYKYRRIMREKTAPLVQLPVDVDIEIASSDAINQE